MALPIAVILKTLTTLGSAVGVFVTQHNKDRADEKRAESGKLMADFRADLQKQSAFIATLTKQVESLAVQVEKHQAENFRLKFLALGALGISLVLAVAVIWMALNR